jgi:O-antigen biosynthesis protein
MNKENWQKDYQSDIQIDSDNSSLAKQLSLIGENKSVIEFGCATGYFSRMLSERGCNVVGVEINSDAAKQAQKYCEEAIVADLDFTPLDKILSQRTFDVAVFGDVLEHLRDPWRILENLRNHLNPGGFVVASIPNIAHGSVRLSLLQGKFNYQQYGILDNTHIRFFTKASIAEMFENSGYFLDTIERTKVPILADRDDILPSFEKDSVSPDVLKQIESDEESETVQFIIRAYPESDRDRYTALLNKFAELKGKNKELSEVLDKVNVENQLITTSTWWKLRKLFFR